MKFFFPKNEPEALMNQIMEELGGRELGKLLSFEVSGNDLTVTISKLGTSVIEFSGHTKDGGIEYDMSREKIAFAHKAFKGDVMAKLCKVIEKVGGTVITTG